MHVTHVISGLDLRSGGPVTALMGLADALVAAGIEVTIVSSWAIGNDLSVADRLRQSGIEVKLIGPVRTPLQCHREMKPVLHQLIARTNFVHIHGLWEDIQHHAARIARSRRVPYIVRPCGMLDPWSLAQRRWKKRLYMAWRLRQNLNNAAALHFTATAERDVTSPLSLRTAAIVEPNGLDVSEFDPLPKLGAFRHRYGIPTDRPVVLFLSRIHYKKGLDLLIPAFARARNSAAMLVLAGPGEPAFINALKTLAKTHGIADRVLFTGMLHGSDRIAAMADADLFALTSRQENFGIAVAEALASGTPVLISDQVNICNDVAAAGVGTVVPLEIDAIATRLTEWLDDHSLRQAAAGRARPFAFEQYDWQRIAERWVSHYRRLAATP